VSPLEQLAAALAGGVFGVIGTLCFFLAFGTDYWLLASDNCGPYTWPTETTTAIPPAEAVSEAPPGLILHHEGFFWRCVFQSVENLFVTLHFIFWITEGNPNFSQLTLVTLGQLRRVRPLVVLASVWCVLINERVSLCPAVFRGFWTVLVILGLASALAGGFLLVCGVPFISHKLYRLGGALLITSGLCLCSLPVPVVDVKRYVLQERGDTCPGAQVSVLYGLSFMAAAAGVPLELVSGLVFLLAGRALRGSK
uniref:Uncharacterized protein n=1 Tax=Salarias fasciatus TaxID=181472 RepID=A0A672HRJ9_SALFA